MAKPKNKRLYPSILYPSYVHLIRLRESILNAVSTYNTKGKQSVLLDFGCGDMPYKEIVEPIVGKYVGADLSLNPSADVHFDFDSKTTLPSEYADLILSSQVLEHVDEVELYLQECHRLIKKDGHVILSTHGYWVYHPTPGDYWRWTSKGLRRTIEKAGFEIVEFKGVMSVSASGLQLFQDGIISSFKNKYIIGGLAFIFQSLILFFDKISSSEKRDIDASLYVVVARRK